MKVIDGESAREKWHGPAPVVALGMFDGVHAGHRALIRRAMRDATRLGGSSVVFTFEPHPASVLTPGQAPTLLTLKEEKLRLLADMNPDAVIIYPFTRELSEMPAEAFVQKVLVRQLGVREVVVGYNFNFGAGGRGDRRLLARLAAESGFDVVVIPPVSKGRHVVSSSTIRKALECGDVRLARELLGYHFTASGEVGRGSQRGRQLGFPTLNLTLPPEKALPGDGVYVVEVDIGAGGVRPGVAAVSAQPTFGGCSRTVEAHLMDYSGELYGLTASVRFLSRIRGIMTFENAEALRRQIATDVQTARDFFTR